MIRHRGDKSTRRLGGTRGNHADTSADGGGVDDSNDKRTRISVADPVTTFFFLAVVCLACKMHKLVLLSGLSLTLGGVMIFAEDIGFFIAAAALWSFGLKAVLPWLNPSPSVPTWDTRVARIVLYRLPLALTTMGTIVFMAIEHYYFYTTRSLLDADALLIAIRSVEPILFIAFRMDGAAASALALVVGLAALALCTALPRG
ncbi:unnamed protein product, partial [Discosporangium mesarthrocarpum]